MNHKIFSCRAKEEKVSFVGMCVDAVNGPTCNHLTLATTSSGLQNLTIRCFGSVSAAKYACSGNITLTNTFGDTSFVCDGTPQGANDICRNSRFSMTSAPGGQNTAHCNNGPDCTNMIQQCIVGTCSCIGTTNGCLSRQVVTNPPTTAPITSPPSSAPTTSGPTRAPVTSAPSMAPSSVPSAVPSTVPSSHLEVILFPW